MCMIDMGLDICIGKIAHIVYFQYKMGKRGLFKKRSDTHHFNSVVNLKIK